MDAESAREGAAAPAAEAASSSGAISVARRFLLTYGVLLAIATVAMGLWVGQEIETGVLSRTAAVTALYIHSFVAPQVQSLVTTNRLTAEETTNLSNILTGTELGQRIVVFKIWSRDGTVIYSSVPGLVGKQFSLAGDRGKSLAGQVTVDMSDLSDPENAIERQKYTHLVEMYVPILRRDSGQVLASAEFYQIPDDIDAEVASARTRSWLLVLLAAAASFFLVAGMVLRATGTIARQQTRLRSQVNDLSGLLGQVADLNARIRDAGGQAEAIAAQEGRRISADLHDGPGQALALALLQFEELEASVFAGQDKLSAPSQKLAAVRGAISDALTELRQIAAGLRLPELESLPVRDVVARAVRDHERRSGISVGLELGELISPAPLPVKIGLFRALQEGLSNATRHGRGVDVRIRAWENGGSLHLEVSDRGPGFSVVRKPTASGGLGLPGMRERTALVGGTFEIRSTPGQGTMVHLSWPLAEVHRATAIVSADRLEKTVEQASGPQHEGSAA